MASLVINAMTACTAFERPSQSPSDDADWYPVYSAVISSWGPRADLFPDAKVRIVVKAQTEPWKIGPRWAGPSPCVLAKGDHASQIAEAMADYEEINRKSIALLERFLGRADVRVVTEEQFVAAQSALARPDSASGWQIVATLSAVGFSRDRQVAVLSYQESCGITCGGTGFAALVKSERGWNWIPRVVQCMTAS